MVRGKRVCLSFTALALLGYTSADNLWTIDIDLSPAPPAASGPPFSAHATRDPAYLPYQVLGIVGSYFIVVLFIGTLLLSCGQRARKRAQILANEDRPRELIKPHKLSYFDPNSNNLQNRWNSTIQLRNKKSAAVSVKSINSARSPGGESALSFDAGIIEMDKQRRADEMERLYAAVMAQEESRSQANSVHLRSPVPKSPPEYSQRAPQITDAPGLRHLQQEQYLSAPRSPVRAIYPPEGSFPQQHRTPYTSTGHCSNNSSGSAELSSVESVPTTRSSPVKKTRKSLKNIKISGPMHLEDNEDGARTPLSPRVYTNPGIPPEPPTARTVDTFDSSVWPTTPREGDWDYPQEHEEDKIHDLPTASYSQRRGKGRQNFSQPLRLDVPSKTNAPVVSTDNNLPFRQLHWNSPSSPMYPYQGQGPFSAGPTKTTFVEVRRDRLGGAPLTGMATPYSAYMPFTPVTPVTPHLTTRAERRQREREQRTIQGAITEEDQVVDDKELWDEAY